MQMHAAYVDECNHCRTKVVARRRTSPLCWTRETPASLRRASHSPLDDANRIDDCTNVMPSCHSTLQSRAARCAGISRGLLDPRRQKLWYTSMSVILHEVYTFLEVRIEALYRTRVLRPSRALDLFTRLRFPWSRILAFDIVFSFSPGNRLPKRRTSLLRKETDLLRPISIHGAEHLCRSLR